MAAWTSVIWRHRCLWESRNAWDKMNIVVQTPFLLYEDYGLSYACMYFCWVILTKLSDSASVDLQSIYIKSAFLLPHTIAIDQYILISVCLLFMETDWSHVT